MVRGKLRKQQAAGAMPQPRGGAGPSGSGPGSTACGLCRLEIDCQGEEHIVAECTACGRRPFHIDCVREYLQRTLAAEFRASGFSNHARDAVLNKVKNRPQALFARNGRTQRLTRPCPVCGEGTLESAEVEKPAAARRLPAPLPQPQPQPRQPRPAPAPAAAAPKPLQVPKKAPPAQASRGGPVQASGGGGGGGRAVVAPAPAPAPAQPQPSGSASTFAAGQERAAKEARARDARLREQQQEQRQRSEEVQRMAAAAAEAYQLSAGDGQLRVSAAALDLMREHKRRLRAAELVELGYSPAACARAAAAAGGEAQLAAELLVEGRAPPGDVVTSVGREARELQQAGARLGLGPEAVEAALVAAGGDWAQAAALMESQAGGGWSQAAQADPTAAWQWGGSGLDAWAAEAAPPALQAAAAGASKGQLGWPEDSASSYASGGQASGAGAGKLAELAASAPAEPGWLPPQFSGRPEAAQEEIDELLGMLGLGG